MRRVKVKHGVARKFNVTEATIERVSDMLRLAHSSVEGVDGNEAQIIRNTLIEETAGVVDIKNGTATEDPLSLLGKDRRQVIIPGVPEMPLHGQQMKDLESITQATTHKSFEVA